MSEASRNHPLNCLECGTKLAYYGSGRRPHYCSQTCRSRAWEKRRAARDGLVAQELVERIVEVEAPLNAEAVAAWLNGHPRRLSKVLKLMDWTQAQRDGLRHGLEGGDSHLSVVADETVRVERGQANDVVTVRLELLRARKQIEVLSQEIEQFRTAQQDRHEAYPQTFYPPESSSPPANYKTVSVGGKSFDVPQDWSRQQIRKWCREHPDHGR